MLFSEVFAGELGCDGNRSVWDCALSKVNTSSVWGDSCPLAMSVDMPLALTCVYWIQSINALCYFIEKDFQKNLPASYKFQCL